jgi:hypothetical protein
MYLEKMVAISPLCPTIYRGSASAYRYASRSKAGTSSDACSDTYASGAGTFAFLYVGRYAAENFKGNLFRQMFPVLLTTKIYRAQKCNKESMETRVSW